jgi:hypothetical protein
MLIAIPREMVNLQKVNMPKSHLKHKMPKGSGWCFWQVDFLEAYHFSLYCSLQLEAIGVALVLAI